MSAPERPSGCLSAIRATVTIHRRWYAAGVSPANGHQFDPPEERRWSRNDGMGTASVARLSAKASRASRQGFS